SSPQPTRRRASLAGNMPSDPSVRNPRSALRRKAQYPSQRENRPVAAKVPTVVADRVASAAASGGVTISALLAGLVTGLSDAELRRRAEQIGKEQLAKLSAEERTEALKIADPAQRARFISARRQRLRAG